MPDSTRRNFLIATGAGAAAVGVASALPGSADAGSTSAAPAKLPADVQPLVAHVADPRTGSLSLLVGEREVTVHDPDLVARLARAAATGEA
ncbi:MAG TPA: twin-arginine translocation signal domain-containing protein [Jatrophihabitans sp.]|nr:twin-arginine translocation signal domain-containing protein [Jatrophihabitans sp.]